MNRVHFSLRSSLETSLTLVSSLPFLSFYLRLAAGKVLSATHQLGPDKYAQGRADRDQEGL